MKISPNELLPWRFVVNDVPRNVFAKHVRYLRKKYGNTIAKKAIQEIIYIGSLNPKGY